MGSNPIGALAIVFFFSSSLPSAVYLYFMSVNQYVSIRKRHLLIFFLIFNFDEIENGLLCFLNVFKGEGHSRKLSF